MSMTRRLVDLIEGHADELTDRVVAGLKRDRQTIGYRRFDDLELGRRARALYAHLGFWLRSSSDLEVEDAFFQVGRERCREGVPLSDVIGAQFLTRRCLWEFIDGKVGDSVVELRGELDLQILVVRFFDRAIYHSARGYEAEAKERAQSGSRATA